jgi:hypothetical protein
MARSRRRDPKAIAFWRYEQIEPALAAPPHEARGRVVRELARAPVVWPAGLTRRISLATLYRWIALYVSLGLAALRPRRRKDHGTSKPVLPDDVVARAFALLVDDPEMTFTLQRRVLEADPERDLTGTSKTGLPATDHADPLPECCRKPVRRSRGCCRTAELRGI